ncbi:MAG: hypothetical protein AABX96_00080 [Nanoarchaeota archaeon]
MKYLTLRVIFILMIFLLIGFFFQENNIKTIESVMAQQTAIGKGPVKTVPPLFSCDYENITAIFQRNGMPSQSIIKSIEKIDLRYMSLFLYNNLSNISELYLYDLGNDLQLNTQDDRGFLIDSIFLTNPVQGEYRFTVTLTTPTGNITHNKLYWVKPLPSGEKEIKSCTLNSQGCTNINIITTFPLFTLQAMAPSPPQDRIYMVYLVNYPSTSSYYISCSIQSGNLDSCNPINGMSNFGNWIIHSSNTHSYYKNLRGMGFISDPISPRPRILPLGTIPPINLFDITSGQIVSLPSGIHKDSISSIPAPEIIAIQRDNLNPTMANDSIIITANGLINTTTLDTLTSVPNPRTLSIGGEFPMVADFTPSNFIIAYNPGRTIVGKQIGVPEKLIYNYSSLTEPPILPRVILPDSSILGYIPSRKSIVQFTCKP